MKSIMSRNKKMWLLPVVFCIVLAFLVTYGCGRKEKAKGEKGKATGQVSQKVKQEKVIKIGAILPLTGPVSFFGEQMKAGQSLAAKMINDGYFWKTKKNIELKFGDSKADPKEGLSSFRKFEFEKVKFIISTLSPVCLALIPEAKRSDILFFADAAHPSISNAGKLIFRHSNTAQQEAHTIANFITKNENGKTGRIKIAVVVVNDDYGISFKNEFENIFQKASNYEINEFMHDKSNTDFRNLTLKIINDSPHYVVICSVGKGPGMIAKRLKEFKYEGTIISAIAFGFPEAQNAAGEAKKGVFYDSFAFDKDDPQFQRINSKFKEIYKKDMPDLSILEFNTVYLVSYAINQVGYDPIAVAKYLKSLGEFNGIGETMSILPSGDVIPAIKIVRCE